MPSAVVFQKLLATGLNPGKAAIVNREPGDRPEIIGNAAGVRLTGLFRFRLPTHFS